jgi:hypothetical protein
MDGSSGVTTPEKPIERFKPSNGFVVGYASLALVVALLVYEAIAVHTVIGLRVALGGLFVGVAAWITQIRPRAMAYPDALVLKNSLQDIRVPLALIDRVLIGMTLNVWVEDRRYVCIGIGKSRRDRRGKSPMTSLLGGSRLHELSQGADRASLFERDISYESWVEDRIKELSVKAKNELRGASAGEVRRSFAVPEIVLLTVTGLAFVASLFL